MERSRNIAGLLNLIWMFKKTQQGITKPAFTTLGDT